MTAPFEHLTHAKAAEAAALVRTGETFSLDLPLDAEPLVGPPHGRPGLVHKARMHNEVRPRGEDGYVVVNDDVIELAMQGTSHWDALAHWGGIESGDDAVFYGGVDMTETFPEFGAKTLGIGLLGGAIVTRGVLVDVVAHVHGGEASYLADEVVIDRTLVEEILEAQGVTLRGGDALCFRTGFHARVAERGFDVRAQGGPVAPGLALDVLDLVGPAGVFALISDNPSVEPLPMTTGRFHTIALKHWGIHLGELWCLDELARSVRQDARVEFMLVSSPLSVARAFGSPANAVAIR
ncbi:MAG: cyclase family protein [Pseudoclavibacter sp.]